MKTACITFVAVAALFSGVTSCTSNGQVATNTPPALNVPSGGSSSQTQYLQIERLATPALKEATEKFSDHDATNRSNPYTEAASNGVLVQDAVAFITTTAGRSSATATALGKVLFPDVLLADLSQTSSSAAYLGVETGGVTGSKFGGRALTDDAIDTDLKAIFGNTVSALGLAADDGKESPCLTTDNVPGPNNQQGFTSTSQIGTAKNQTSTFPYVGAPFTS